VKQYKVFSILLFGKWVRSKKIIWEVGNKVCKSMQDPTLLELAWAELLENNK